MLTVKQSTDMFAYNGQDLGVSEWVEVTQEMINTFAKLTWDDQWVHVDTERAAKDMPGGKTIAHGMMILSMGPGLHRQVYQIENRGKGLHYGYDKVRFINTISPGDRFRLCIHLDRAYEHKNGIKIETTQTFEIEGKEKPAIVANHLLVIFHP